jgi:hypothetical protein
MELLDSKFNKLLQKMKAIEKTVMADQPDTIALTSYATAANRVKF